MFKVIVLVTRKPGMSKADFIHHYETVHVPMVRQFFPQLIDYRRNYIELDGAMIFEGADAPDFDSVTEMWFTDRAAYEELAAANDDPVKGPQLMLDAELFMDTSKTRLLVVDEKGAP